MASDSGKFLIAIPRSSLKRERIRTVGRAVVRIADALAAEIEILQKKHLLSVWVYYKNDGKDWSPVYFDWGKDWSEDEVFASLRSEVYHLSSGYDGFVLQGAARVR